MLTGGHYLLMTAPNGKPQLCPGADALVALSHVAAGSLKLGHSNNGLREGLTTLPIAFRGSVPTTRSCLGTLYDDSLPSHPPLRSSKVF
jgi:hypothetical protein